MVCPAPTCPISRDSARSGGSILALVFPLQRGARFPDKANQVLNSPLSAAARLRRRRFRATRSRLLTDCPLPQPHALSAQASRLHRSYSGHSLGNSKPAGGTIGVLRSVTGIVRLRACYFDFKCRTFASTSLIWRRPKRSRRCIRLRVGLRESGEKLVGLLQILVANAPAARPRRLCAIARVFRVALLGKEICKKG